jgi:hypothetical protein
MGLIVRGKIMLKMPPREKIHEVLSAIADKRIIINDNKAIVISSSGDKKYTVQWQENIYSSNDNATFWQGYAGYPVIAVILLQNKIAYDQKILVHFKNIKWNHLNKNFNNDYAKSVESIYYELREKGIDISYIDEQINNIYASLNDLDIIIKRSKIFPPK